MSGQTRGSLAGNLIIEPSEFARRGESRSGQIAVHFMPRLAEAVLDAKALIEWQAVGEVAPVSGLAESRSRGWFMDLSITGTLRLRCQRCLEPLDWPVGIATRILMMPESAPLPDEELEVEDFDAIPVGHELNLAELIEDELLLSLPAAPRHAQCALPGPAESSGKPSPFAVLAQLKRSH